MSTMHCYKSNIKPALQVIFMKHLLSLCTSAYGISSDNTEISCSQTYVNRNAQNGCFLTREMRIWWHLTRLWQFASTWSTETDGLQYALCKGDKETSFHTAWRPPQPRQISLLPSLWKWEQNNLKTTTTCSPVIYWIESRCWVKFDENSFCQWTKAWKHASGPYRTQTKNQKTVCNPIFIWSMD